MTAEDWLARLHRDGFGIEINMWAEHDEIAVVLWRDGKPVASGEAGTLAEALERAQAHAMAVK